MITFETHPLFRDPIMTIGKLPARRGSVVAGVLVRLTESTKPLTVWDAYELFRTVDLASAISSLRKHYGWPIERVEFPTFKPDGNIIWATGYVLPIMALFAASKDPNYHRWYKQVKVAQAAKRKVNDEKAAAVDAYRFDTDRSAVDKTNRFMAACHDEQVMLLNTAFK